MSSTAEQLQQEIKQQGETVKALKAAKKPKDDPELVAAVNRLNELKEKFAEMSKPVETNPYVKSRPELDDVCKDPTIMPHDVLKTSGHVDRFNDFMVKDCKHDDKFFRADKLLEEELDKRLKIPTISEAERTQYRKDLTAADSFSKEELGAKLREYGVKAPETGNDLTEPYEFNLMFPTPIGPSGLLQGYLRPETAQGIFLNYKYCAEQNSDRMPFGVAQIGKSYRNEIAPRGGLVRQREFTQAEIEFFCQPGDKKFDKFSLIKDMKLALLSSPLQLEGKPPLERTLEDAVATKTVANETLAYFIGRTAQFLLMVGIRPESLRFRQHLPTEMAHYASDCWDAEIEVSTGWMETVGIADRSAFDLTVHSDRTKVDLSAQEKLPEPVSVEVTILGKKAAALLGKDFRQDAAAVRSFLGLRDNLTAVDPAAAKALQAEVEAAGSKEVTLEGGQKVTLKKEHVQFESKTEVQHYKNYTPHVIEPSFGIDRVFTAVLEHAYYARPQDPEEKEKIVRGVLGLSPEVAPYKAIIMPLDQRVPTADKYPALLHTLRTTLSRNGISYKLDDSGVSVGKRYARNDELGAPFAITVDFDSVGHNDGPKVGTVTLRDRDSCKQVRIPYGEVADVVSRLALKQLTWDDVKGSYVEQAETASATMGAPGTASEGGAVAAAPAPAAGGEKAALDGYMKKHRLTEVLNEAVNQTLAAMPEDPVAHLASLLAARIGK